MTLTFDFTPAVQAPALLAPSVHQRLLECRNHVDIEAVKVAPIDPEHAGGEDILRVYGVAPEAAGNCLIVQARRGTQTTTAVCLVPVGYRADLNAVARRHLQAQRISMAPMEQAVTDSGQEYGSITAIGLPEQWPVLVAEQFATSPAIIIGSGLRRSKLQVPFEALLTLSRGQIVPGLARPAC